jgi:hypothetical protein
MKIFVQPFYLTAKALRREAFNHRVRRGAQSRCCMPLCRQTGFTADVFRFALSVDSVSTLTAKALRRKAFNHRVRRGAQSRCFMPVRR